MIVREYTHICLSFPEGSCQVAGNDDNTDMDVVDLDELSETEAVNTLWEKATAVDRASS